MYEDFYGLREMPFSVNPDPRFAYKSLGHQLAQGKMQFAADYKAGLAVLVGPVGCGKTSLANQLVATWSEDNAKTVAFLTTAEDRSRPAFLKLILEGFGFSGDDLKRNYGDNRKILQSFLLTEREAGRHPILVIDEGQRIHSDNIDTLTDLTNFQLPTEKLITIILFAQDNFPNKIRTKDAFRSRIAFTGTLDPFSPEDTLGMIAHRLEVAGATLPHKSKTSPPDISSWLTKEALVELYKITAGVARDVCVLLSEAFLRGYMLDTRPLTAADLLATHSELNDTKQWPPKTEKEKSPEVKPAPPADKLATKPTPRTGARKSKGVTNAGK